MAGTRRPLGAREARFWMCRPGCPGATVPLQGFCSAFWVAADVDCAFSFECSSGFVHTVIRGPGNIAAGTSEGPFLW